MVDSDPVLESALRKLGDSVSREMTEHPTREQLAAYCRGELSAEESEDVAAHVAWCREDADFVLAFREISGLDLVEEEPAGELDAAWSDFQKRHAAGVAGPAAPVSTPAAPGRGAVRRWGMPLALAASVLVAAVSSGWLLVTLGRLERATAPLNGPIIDLEATAKERAGGAEVKEIVLHADESALTVILHPTRELTAKQFSVALRGKRGREVWQDEVRPTELETFHLTFPRELVWAGDYVLELRGRDDGRVEVLDRFPVRIVKP